MLLKGGRSILLLRGGGAANWRRPEEGRRRRERRRPTGQGPVFWVDSSKIGKVYRTRQIKQCSDKLVNLLVDKRLMKRHYVISNGPKDNNFKRASRRREAMGFIITFKMTLG